MKKSLIALAIAGTFAAPAFAASANVDFYGKFRISLNNVNNNQGWSLTDQVSRVGFKGAEDLGGGLKAIYQYETAFNIGTGAPTADSSTSCTSTLFGGIVTTECTPSSIAGGGLGAQRNTFVGLAGDFGTVLAGRHDTPYKLAGSADLFVDTLADAQNTSAAGGIIGAGNAGSAGFDLRGNNAIAYVAPSFSGLTLIGAIVPGNGGSNFPQRHNLTDAYSLAALYGNGPLTANLAYEDHNKLLDENAWKLNVGYTMGDLKLGGTYEGMSNLNATPGAKSKNFLVSAAYGMGPITLAAQFGKRNQNATAGNDDLTDTTVGVVYGLSKRTSTYLGYAHYKPATGSSTNGLTMGMNHDF